MEAIAREVTEFTFLEHEIRLQGNQLLLCNQARVRSLIGPGLRSSLIQLDGNCVCLSKCDYDTSYFETAVRVRASDVHCNLINRDFIKTTQF